MSILALGLSYRTAAIELRERVAFPADDVKRAMRALRQRIQSVSEVAILSTCNRTEIYCATATEDVDSVAEWIAEDRRVSTGEIGEAMYCYRDLEAAQHVMRVASGLDSQVLGEPQIMGQLKSAYDAAKDIGTMGPELRLLERASLNIAKKVRTDTDIGKNPVSVAYAATSLAQRIFTDMSTSRALLVGAGETIELVATHLSKAGVRDLAIANRTLERAVDLARDYDAEALRLTDIGQRLHEFDIVISSTGSALPIIGKGTAEAAARKRRHRPIFMVDIAIPRDIEPGVGDLEAVYLYSIDDLTQIIEENLRGREDAAREAEAIISAGAADFVRQQGVLRGRDVLQSFRQSGEAIRQAAFDQARAKLAAGDAPEAVLDRLSKDLANKLLHGPTVMFREAAANKDDALLDLLKKSHGL